MRGSCLKKKQHKNTCDNEVYSVLFFNISWQQHIFFRQNTIHAPYVYNVRWNLDPTVRKKQNHTIRIDISNRQLRQLYLTEVKNIF